MKVILTLWTLNYVGCVAFSCLIISILFLIEEANLQKSDSQISEEHYQTSNNWTNVLDFIGWFSNYAVLDGIKWLCAFTKETTERLTTKPQS